MFVDLARRNSMSLNSTHTFTAATGSRSPTRPSLESIEGDTRATLEPRQSSAGGPLMPWWNVACLAVRGVDLPSPKYAEPKAEILCSKSPSHPTRYATQAAGGSGHASLGVVPGRAGTARTGPLRGGCDSVREPCALRRGTVGQISYIQVPARATFPAAQPPVRRSVAKPREIAISTRVTKSGNRRLRKHGIVRFMDSPDVRQGSITSLQPTNFNSLFRGGSKQRWTFSQSLRRRSFRKGKPDGVVVKRCRVGSQPVRNHGFSNEAGDAVKPGGLVRQRGQDAIQVRFSDPCPRPKYRDNPAGPVFAPS
jgi:hypothetical protein